MSFAPRHELASSLRVRHLVHSFCCALMVTSLAMPGHAAAARSTRSTKARVALPDAPAAPATIHSADESGFAETESGCAEGRIRDYLDRHGDFGLIDAEALLEVSGQVQRERENRVHAFSIGGSVWTSIGPTNGAGRATAVAVHPTVPGTAIIGAAGGGAWKTLDNGATWTALTDSIPNLSIGAVAFAQSNPGIVYLGTGEGGSAIDFIPGIGLLYSTDGGTTWNLPASVLATEFYRISVNPSNASDLVVGTNAGALRSTSGQNGPWTTVIANTSSTGAAYGDVTDIVRDPTNAQVLYAATWDRLSWCVKRGCGAPSNYASPTVLKSTDGGSTWTPAATGLPVSTSTFRVNRVSLAIAPSSPQTLYAATSTYDTTTGYETSRIYKTTNGGASWTEKTTLSGSSDTSISAYLILQGWYDNTIVVSPTDPNVVLAGGVTYVKSTDGGDTWANMFAYPSDVHVDAHDLRYDAAGTLYVANDGGIWTSTDSGGTATNRNAGLVTRQYYALANDPANRKRIFGGTQDNGTNRRPDAGTTSWDFFTGGDGMQCGVSPVAPNIAYSTYQYGDVNRSMNAGGAPPTVARISPVYVSGEAKPFLSKFAIDPNNPATIYTCSYRIWRSQTAGDAWAPLSITTTDGSTWQTTAPLTALTIAKSDSNVMMAAQYATIFRSTNGGASWVRTTNGLPGKTVNAIEIDPTNPLIAYASLAGMSGSSVYKTTDGGGSWIARASGLPSFSAQVVRVDPTDSSTLYCGTDVGVYRSTDAGGSWTRFGSGLPAVSVYDIQILNDGSIVRAGTHGRGAWELTVTGNTNTPPLAAITTPATAQTVPVGTTLSFTGSLSDPDSGDAVSGTWTFPDAWEIRSASAGTSSVTHKFDRSGTFPVTLAAKDSHGAIAAATVNVTVPQTGDSCASPIVVPPSGPFPWTTTVDLTAATTQSSDALSSCYPYQLGPTVWLTFTPAVTGTYQFSACGSSISGVFASFTGNACGPYTEAPLCYVDQYPKSDCTADPPASVTLTAGVPIRIMVTRYFSNQLGKVVFTVTQNSSFSPQVLSVAPAAGTPSGGTPVTITGSGFVNGATVSFGGVAATGVTYLTPSILTATTPAHAAGTVDVSVSNPGGAASALGSGFAFSGLSSSATAVSSSLNPALVGQSVTFTATVTPSAATGTVTFNDGATTLGTGTLSGGTAGFTTASLTAGVHAITGNYGGDSTYAGSASPVLTQIVSSGTSLPGDANGDGSVNTADIFYLINYLFAGGLAPVAGDANADGKVTAADVFYLVNYVFAGGPAPH